MTEEEPQEETVRHRRERSLSVGAIEALQQLADVTRQQNDDQSLKSRHENPEEAIARILRRRATRKMMELSSRVFVDVGDHPANLASEEEQPAVVVKDETVMDVEYGGDEDAVVESEPETAPQSVEQKENNTSAFSNFVQKLKLESERFFNRYKNNARAYLTLSSHSMTM